MANGTITVDPQELDQGQAASSNPSGVITVDPSQVEVLPPQPKEPARTYSLSDIGTPGRTALGPGIAAQFEQPYTAVRGLFGQPELSEASKQRIADERIKQGSIRPGESGVGGWLQDLQSDIRHGTGATAPGRALRAMGAPGTESEVSPRVAETVGGPFVGPIRAAYGFKKALGPYAGEPADFTSELRGLNEGIRGVMQTAAPVVAATQPEFIPTMTPYAVAGEAGQRGLEKAGVSPDVAEFLSNVALLGGGAALASTPERAPFGGVYKNGAREPVVGGDTVPDYLSRLTEKTDRAVRVNAPVELPKLPETTEPPAILARAPQRSPIQELAAQASEARGAQAFRQQLTNEISEGILNRLRDEGLLERQPAMTVIDRRAVRPEDVEAYQPPRRFIGSENIPPAVVPSAARIEPMIRSRVTVSPDEVMPVKSAPRMLPAAPPEAMNAAQQAHDRFEQELAQARSSVRPSEPLPIASPSDISADSKRVGHLFAGRMGNPIERQYTNDLWRWMLDRKGPEPEPPPNVGQQRAGIIRDRLAEISQGQFGGRVPNPSTVFSPDVLDEAKAMMAFTHDFLSQQERPGRYRVGEGEMGDVSPAKGRFAFYGIKSLRNQFPWFANLRESPGDLAKALQRGEGPAYDRLVTAAADHIMRSREENARMARSVEPNLDDLAAEVRDLDPDLAAFLTDAAQGKVSSWTETKQEQLAKIEEKIADARQAIQFGRAIDDLAAEERAGGIPEVNAGEEETPTARSAEGAGIGAAEAPQPAEAVTRPQLASGSLEQNEPEGVLPGMGAAVREQERAAGIAQAERMSREVSRPPESIESAAGTMERESPLFRGTEASPQSEMFGQAPARFGSRNRKELATKSSTPEDQAQALRTENLRLEDQLRNRPDAPAGERRDAQERIEQNRQMIEALERSKGEAGFATLDLIRDVLSGRLPKEAWQRFVAEPFIRKVLGIGDKYAKVREADPEVAAGLHMLDNAPAYFRAKTAQTVHDIIGGLSRQQERLFTLMADADSRENLRTNHPAEYRQATNDPAIQEALRKYRPIEKQLTAVRERMGGATLDRDYLRRVYDQHIAGIGQAEASESSDRATTAFDRVIQPQRLGNMSREATAEYHYQNGLHEFGPAFGTKSLATNLRALEDQVARDFISKATEIKPGDPEPRFITYRGQKYYRPDVARDMREAGQKNVREYDRYDPTAGVKYPQKGASRYLGPRDVVRAMNDYSAGQGEGPGAVRRFLQEQVIGYGFGIPHVANILRRVTQSAPMGAANPEAWARAWKVAFGKELRERGIQGLDDPTFDRLMQHGAITNGEMANLKRYWGGNLNPANWARSLAGIGHKLIFEPGSFGGFGGVDQRARIYIADLVKSQNPSLGDEEIARAVNTQLGDYNRANWSERQKVMAKFMLFPGWDASSMRWVIEHPIKTTVPPALLIWTANQILNRYGQNRPEDASDIQNIHWGDRSIGVTLLRESMARNLMRPLFNYAQSRIRGESSQRSIGEAARGITQGAGGLVGTLRSDITGVIDLAMNRESPFGGRELVTQEDYNTPGRVLPNRALEKQAALVVRHAIPALDRMIGSDQAIDFRAFAGSNVGLPNYKYGAEQRLKRNTAESMEVSQTLSRLAKTNPETARQFIKDPDNAAYALFRNEFSEMSKTLKRIDDAKERVTAAKNLSADEKRARLERVDHARQNLLRNADGLDRLLFERKQELRSRTFQTPSAPLTGIREAAGANR